LAICLTLMTYLASSVLGLIIFVQRATCAAHARMSAGPHSRAPSCAETEAGLTALGLLASSQCYRRDSRAQQPVLTLCRSAKLQPRAAPRCSYQRIFHGQVSRAARAEASTPGQREALVSKSVLQAAPESGSACCSACLACRSGPAGRAPAAAAPPASPACPIRGPSGWAARARCPTP